MSLRLRGGQMVTVVLREQVEGERGRIVVRERKRVSVRARIRESTVEDVQSAGVNEVSHMKSLMCVDFPGDDLSEVIDTQGCLYTVVGEPRLYDSSPSTRHHIVLLRAKGVRRG